MAIQNTAPAQNVTTLGNGRPQADAFLNISVVAADGSEHRLRVGIPLHTTNRVENSIINKMLLDPEAKLTVVGSVYLVNDPSRETKDLVL